MLSALASGFVSTFLGVAGPDLLARGDRSATDRLRPLVIATLLIALVGWLAEWEVSGELIRWSWVVLLTVGWLAGTAAGRALSSAPPPRVTAAIALLVLAWRLSVGPEPLHEPIARLTETVPGSDHALVLAVGLLAGAASVAVGLAGGLITMPLLRLCFADPSGHDIRMTSLAVIAAIAALELCRRRRVAAHVDAPVLHVVLPVGLAGAVLGTAAVHLAPVALERLVFALLLALVAVQLLTEAWPEGIAARRRVSPGGRHEA